jgi:hypothetical protein
MLEGYEEVARKLGTEKSSERGADLIVRFLFAHRE